MITEKAPNVKKLVDYKIPFVLRDLEMGFNSASRERSTLEKLRYWQIIITSALITFLIGNKEVSVYFSLIILIMNLVIFYIELGIKWQIFLIGKKTGEQERLLETESDEKFEENIIKWKFGTGISNPYYYKT